MTQVTESTSLRENTIVLSMRNIHMSYGSTRALSGVDFDLYRGELHALVGEHRAGKSSLVKILSGAARISSGDIIYMGKRIPFFTPMSAIRGGIGIVYQELNIIPDVSAVDNIFTGQMIRNRFGTLHHEKMRRKTAELFHWLDYEFDYAVPLYKLTPGQQYMVEFARVLAIEPKVIILDELSNKLTPTEMLRVYRAIIDFQKRGTSIIYISHDMDEILKIADQVTILKDGYRRGTELVKNLDKYRLFQLTYSYMLDQEQLKQSESKFVIMKRYLENIIHNLPAGIVVLDINNRVQLLNYAALELLSAEQDRLSGREISPVLEELEFENRGEIMERIQAREHCSWEELQLGEESLIKLSITPLLDEENVFIGTIILMEDKLLDTFLDKYIIQREKMASVAEVAVGVAHEINNPLFIMKNYLQLVREKNKDDDIAAKILKIENELNRIVEIISSLLSFSRVGEIPGDSIEITSVLEDVFLLLQHKISAKHIELQKDICGGCFQVRGNENKLKQVFLNILMNSIEAVLDKGTISLNVSGDPGQDWVVIRIRDSGYGIPDEIKESIFNPFFSTKVGKQNTGLGLSICQHIIKEYRGKIEFDSEPGKYTEFIVKLPCSDGGQ